MVGQIISHYKIIEKIGSGGMGVVYKAQDLKLDRPVALKFLPAHMGEDDTQKQRFIQEAKAASALDHPNICTIYEIDETEPVAGEKPFGQIFIAMACYDGQTLQDKIASDAPMPVDESISIILQLAQGLQKAHEKDIVHRDVKPANIIVTNEGEVKIVDFGLAKLKGQPRLTKDESTLGTITYMSPEQARGEEIDVQTDIWSLGIVFYEMLAGKSPFDADYDQAVIYNILNEIPEPINNLNKNVPHELNNVVQKCLEKNKDKRYQTVKEFYSALIQVIKKYKYTIKMRSGEFQPAGLSEKNVNLKPALFGAAALIVALLIVAVVIFMPDSKYSSYEEAFFKTYFEEARDISKDDRSLENVKAHRYYLLTSAYANKDTIPEQVKREYRDLLTQNPDSPQAYYYLGLVYFLSAENLSERDSVWILYDEAENLSLNDIYFKLDELKFYKKNNFTQQALDVVTILLERYPENPDVMFEIGSFYQRTVSDTSKARDYYNNTLRMYDDFVLANLGLMQLALKKNNFNSAKIYLEKAERINSEDIEVVRGKVSLYEREGRFDEAKFYLNKAVQIDRDDPNVLFYLGLIADHEGDLVEKERYFELARKINRQMNPSHKVGWRIRYQLRPGYFLYDGYLDLIEQGYRDRLKLNDNVSAKNDLAYFLAIENRNLNEALQLIEEALEQKPDDIDFLDTRTVILYQQGEYQSAHETVLRYEERIIKDALKKDPTYSYYLGRIKWAVGDTVSAKNYFNYTLKQTEPDAGGKRDQQELIKFIAEHNL